MHQAEGGSSALLLNYPEDVLSSVREMIVDGGNIHIHGKKGSGKSTLLRFLAREFSKEPHTIFIPQRYDVEDKHEDLPRAMFLPPRLDYWKVFQQKNPEVIIVDGDDSLKAKNGKQFPSGEAIDEDFLPYQHDHTLWDITNKHVQVLSAGERSVPEMNDHLKEYGLGAYGLNYDLDVEIIREVRNDGTVRFNLEAHEVKYVRTQKIEGMRDFLKSISKGNLPK